MARVQFLRHVIENQDGWRVFWVDGKSIEREIDLQILYRLVWFASAYDVNFEVNNGRGPADAKVSLGSHDKTIVEFKLAKNTKLRQNLAKQSPIYERANAHPVPPHPSIKVVLFFSEKQETSVRKILRELEMDNDPNVVLIDVRCDNKPSASTA